MTRARPIFIACPALRRVVRGTCATDTSGNCKLAGDGSFPLDVISCSQDNGRCPETLCALHRYNRRGPGTWYPDRVWTPRTSSKSRKRRDPGENHEGAICVDA
ncbi:MAG: hypothetical protein ACOC9S_04460 [Planctomycetota bacterium]